MELTKWPRLLVVGGPVTEEQANDILIRTDPWTFMTNDRAWRRQVFDLVGVEHSDPYGHFSELADVADGLCVLDLEYLHNDRIMSSWIGGPKGWCDWDGTIGCSTYNVGKWPSAESLTSDWTAIAEAFPYLRLRAQVVPDEGESQRAAVEWRIVAGTVQVINEPDTLLTRPGELGEDAFKRIVSPRGERGVSIERLAEALAQVRASRAGAV